MYIKQCLNCGKDYQKLYKYSATQWNNSKFCSRLCQQKYKTINDGMTRYERYRRKRGMLKIGTKECNDKVSKLTRLAMQRPEVQEKIRQPKGAQSLERRMLQSQLLAGRMPKNLNYANINNGYGNIKRGYYDINGTTMFFRSKWEANYALYLDFLIDHKEIYKWEFEPETFMFEAIKLGTRSYTPDFKVYYKDGRYEWHEVKGYMDSKSKTKLKRFAKYYPEEKLVLIDTKEYNLLKKQIGKLCKFY